MSAGVMVPMINLETGGLVSSADVIPTGEVHPVANLFPMLPDDELQELADDIRANGLQHPIVLDKDGVLIDGRNRWAACQVAGVDPRFEMLNGQDPVAYILSANVNRRHLTKGQRAMAASEAVFVTNTEVLSRGHRSALADAAGASDSRIAKARVVHEYASDLVPGVLAGSPSLDDAYETAKRRKQSADSDEARLKRLQEGAADLATLVTEERLALSEAWSMYQERIGEEERRRKDITRGYADAISKLWAFLAADEDIVVTHWEPGVNPLKTTDVFRHLGTASGVRIVARRLERLATEIDAIGGELA